MSERRMWPTPRTTDAEGGPRQLNGQGYRTNKAGTITYGANLADAVRPTTDAPTVSNQLTLFAEAFPVSPTPWLADVADLPTNAISGPSSPVSFASLDPAGWWRKTSQGYSQVTLDGSLARFSETWPRAGMTRNGTAFRRPPLAPLTAETESGSWPTPRAYSHGPDSNQPGLTALDIRVRGLYRDDPKHARYWPTPRAEHDSGGHRGQPDTLHSAVKLWPTPKGSPSGPDYARATRPGSGGDDLATMVARESSPLPPASGVSGSLNPVFVEWLMAYPLGFTDCAAWATRSSPSSPNGSRGRSSRGKPRTRRRRGDPHE